MRHVADFLSKLFSGPLDVSWLDDLAATGLALPDGLYAMTPKTVEATDSQGTPRTAVDRRVRLSVRLSNGRSAALVRSALRMAHRALATSSAACMVAYAAGQRTLAAGASSQLRRSNRSPRRQAPIERGDHRDAARRNHGPL